MTYTNSDLGWISQGYDLGDSSTITSTQYNSLLTSTPSIFGTTGSLNPNEISDQAYLTSQLQQSLGPGSPSYQDIVANQISSTGVVVPYNGSLVSQGTSTNPSYDSNTILGQITPDILSPSFTQDGYGSYVGSDIQVLIEASNTSSTGSTMRVSKQLVELNTLTISIHRETGTARALGYINPKGFAVGTRTIAGTMILTPFTVDILFNFLQPGMISNFSKDTTSAKVDQLPPFDITIFFANEEGYASYRRILGVKLITDGEIYSINDMMIERTISYMASDFTPLLPITASSLMNNPDPTAATSAAETTPSDLFSQYAPSTTLV